ncbi:DNA-binding protein SMUBP-2 [Folsomia candida]|uniref:DNA-binding protein SMUBP-2 n=1 Tax=Folsomia candida TaxID=158441 RepID=UPI001604AFD4|nr:DNA-binding protein SMUBP-2 [Folsomia candida]
MEDTLRAASHASRDSKLTYEDKLIDAKVVLERKVRPNYGELLNATGGSRIVILDHKFFEKNEPITNGYYNIGEVNEVSRLVQTLLDKGIPSEDITILTFYEMQRQELLRAMPCKSDIRNVDAFQGRENRVVIISFVRSNTSPKASVGFLNSINRINVALSRAQEFLFIVWNTEFFRRSHLQHFKKLCKLVHHCPKLSDLNL